MTHTATHAIPVHLWYNDDRMPATFHKLGQFESMSIYFTKKKLESRALFVRYINGLDTRYFIIEELDTLKRYDIRHTDLKPYFSTLDKTRSRSAMRTN